MVRLGTGLSAAMSKVRRTVFAHQSSTIKAEYHIQIQQCHVVDDVVESSLRKSTVNVAEGEQAVFGHTAREGDSMSFGNAYVESPFRHLRHHNVH